MQYPEPIAQLIDGYMKLPGIGQKSATRLAFFTIDMAEDDVTAFSKALIAAKRDLHFAQSVATSRRVIRVQFVQIRRATKPMYWWLNNLKTSWLWKR